MTTKVIEVLQHRFISNLYEFNIKINAFFQVIVLDTDVSFATDIAELWKMFSFLSGLKVNIVYVHVNTFWETDLLGHFRVLTVTYLSKI